MKNRMARCRLRSHRLTWALSQKALASILDLNVSHLSRIENGKSKPALETALACQVIFGTPPDEMFPNVFMYTEYKTVCKLEALHEILKGSTGAVGRRRYELYNKALHPKEYASREVERRPK